MFNRNSHYPTPTEFLAAAEASFHADWSDRDFVGRDDLVADVLGRVGLGSCGYAASDAEAALEAIFGEDF